MMRFVRSAPEVGSSRAALPAYRRGYFVGSGAVVIKAQSAIPDGWVELRHPVASGNGAFIAGGAAGETTHMQPTGRNDTYGKVSATVMLPLPSQLDHAASVIPIPCGVATRYRTDHWSWIMTAASGWEAV